MELVDVRLDHRRLRLVVHHQVALVVHQRVLHLRLHERKVGHLLAALLERNLLLLQVGPEIVLALLRLAQLVAEALRQLAQLRDAQRVLRRLLRLHRADRSHHEHCAPEALHAARLAQRVHRVRDVVVQILALLQLARRVVEHDLRLLLLPPLCVRLNTLRLDSFLPLLRRAPQRGVLLFEELLLRGVERLGHLDGCLGLVAVRQSGWVGAVEEGGGTERGRGGERCETERAGGGGGT